MTTRTPVPYRQKSIATRPSIRPRSSSRHPPNFTGRNVTARSTISNRDNFATISLSNPTASPAARNHTPTNKFAAPLTAAHIRTSGNRPNVRAARSS